MNTKMCVYRMWESLHSEKFVKVSGNAMRSSYVVRSCCKADVVQVQCMVITICYKGDTTYTHDLLLQD